jgi:P27 family predicted phage terminase small subunit
MATRSTGVGRGNKAEPLERKRARGARIRNGLQAAPVPQAALAVVDVGSVPVAPEVLGEVGVAYWEMFWSAGRRHLSELHDSALMLRLCSNLEKIAVLEDWLGDDVERRWYTTANGQVVTHPAVKQVDQLDAQNTAWMSLLGFTPSDRARLGLAEIRVANELDQFRKRKSNVVDSEVVSEV